MYLIFKTPSETRLGLAERAKERRLSLNLTQEGLARRSGVSLPSLKRFERTGLISLQSLLQIALVLEALDEFEGLFQTKTILPETLDDLLSATPHGSVKRRKGRIK